MLLGKKALLMLLNKMEESGRVSPKTLPTYILLREYGSTMQYMAHIQTSLQPITTEQREAKIRDIEELRDRSKFLMRAIGQVMPKELLQDVLKLDEEE